VTGREGPANGDWPTPKGRWGQLYQRMQYAMGLAGPFEAVVLASRAIEVRVRVR
jgi:hypothetical protein